MVITHQWESGWLILVQDYKLGYRRTFVVSYLCTVPFSLYRRTKKCPMRRFERFEETVQTMVANFSVTPSPPHQHWWNPSLSACRAEAMSLQNNCSVFGRDYRQWTHRLSTVVGVGRGTYRGTPLMSANVAQIVVGRDEFRVDSLSRRGGGTPRRPSESLNALSSPPFLNLDSHVLKIFTLTPAPPSQITVSESNIFA